MFKGALLLIALCLTAAVVDAKADGLQVVKEKTFRVEIGAGIAKHHLAPEGSWWYEGFEQNTKLTTKTWAIGASWMPLAWKSMRFGMRGGYTDLGKVQASNSFPVTEDHSVNDARVNPHCDRETLSGCTGKFDGYGTARGFYAGPVIEKDFSPVSVGLEAGILVYQSAWVASNLRIVDENGEFVPNGWDALHWDNAKAIHATPYIGASIRYEYFILSARRFGNVHASRADVNKDFVGMTSGPVWSILAGISIPLD